MHESPSRTTSGKPEALIVALFLTQVALVLMLHFSSATALGLPVVALGYMSLVLAPFGLGLVFNRLVDAEERSGDDRPTVRVEGDQQ